MLICNFEHNYELFDKFKQLLSHLPLDKADSMDLQQPLQQTTPQVLKTYFFCVSLWDKVLR